MDTSNTSEEFFTSRKPKKTPIKKPPLIKPTNPTPEPTPLEQLEQLHQLYILQQTDFQQLQHNPLICKFGTKCTSLECRFSHPNGRTLSPPENCKFNRDCTKKGCKFVHPAGRLIDEVNLTSRCNFGRECTRPNCRFVHPIGRAIDE